MTIDMTNDTDQKDMFDVEYDKWLNDLDRIGEQERQQAFGDQVDHYDANVDELDQQRAWLRDAQRSDLDQLI